VSVDVIVPTFNRPGYLARALASIRAQTYRDYSIVVVNDGGEDVRQLCDLFGPSSTVGMHPSSTVGMHPSSTVGMQPILYMRHSQNRGLPAARNTGIRATRSELVAYLDDDDVWLPEHLEKLARYYEEVRNKGLGIRLVYSNSFYWFDERGYDVMLNEDPTWENLLERNMTPVCSVLHERSLFADAGLFDETLKNHEDYDLWLRMRQVCEFGHLRETTALYSKRTGSEQMSMQAQGMREGKALVQKANMERMRLQA